MAIHGKVAAFYSHVSGAASHATLEAMSTIVGSTTLYTIDDSAKKYWDAGGNVTVYVGGAATSSDFYAIQWSGGRVVFNSAPGATVTIDCNHYTVAKIGGGFNWSLNPRNNLAEVPTFGDNWMYRLGGIRDWDVTFERFWTNDGFATVYDRNNDVHAVLYLDIGSNTVRYEGRGKISTMDISAPAQEVIDQSITISGEGTMYDRLG